MTKITSLTSQCLDTRKPPLKDRQPTGPPCCVKFDLETSGTIAQGRVFACLPGCQCLRKPEELQRVLSRHVGPGYWTTVLWQSSQCSVFLSFQFIYWISHIYTMTTVPLTLLFSGSLPLPHLCFLTNPFLLHFPWEKDRPLRGITQTWQPELLTRHSACCPVYSAMMFLSDKVASCNLIRKYSNCRCICIYL